MGIPILILIPIVVLIPILILVPLLILTLTTRYYVLNIKYKN